MFYRSPVMAGVQALAYQTNQSKANANASPASNADPSLWSASVQWAGMGGRARVGVAYDRHKDFTSIGQADTGWAVKGGWNLVPTFTCGTAVTGDVKAKQWGAAVAVPVGPARSALRIRARAI